MPLLPIKETLKIVEKAWGHEEWIVNNEDYCLKFLYFNSGAKMSVHSHNLKRESWRILFGSFNFIYFDYEKGYKIEEIIKKDDIITINKNILHGLEALEDSMIIEVSTTHREDDSYRISPSQSYSKIN